MHFPFFLFLIWIMGLYYRAIHRAYIRELAELAPLLEASGEPALAGKDWRLLKREGEVFVLRRAFNAQGLGKEELLRYAPPFFFFLVTLFLLQSWELALGYAATAALGWLCCDTVLRTGARKGYDVVFFGYRLFGEDF